MANKVQHDIDNKKFVVQKDFNEAYLTYSETSPGVLDFKSTFVPEVFRGQGVAADLVKAGLDHVRQNNFKVIPSCSYVDTYIKRHQDDWGDLAAVQEPGGSLQLNVCEQPSASAEHARLDDDNEPCDDGRSGNR